MVSPAKWCSMRDLSVHNTKMTHPQVEMAMRWVCHLKFEIVSFQMASVLSVSRRQPTLVKCWLFFFERLIREL